jgi:hypothetical protein
MRASSALGKNHSGTPAGIMLSPLRLRVANRQRAFQIARLGAGAEPQTCGDQVAICQAVLAFTSVSSTLKSSTLNSSTLNSSTLNSSTLNSSTFDSHFLS